MLNIFTIAFNPGNDFLININAISFSKLKITIYNNGINKFILDELMKISNINIIGDGTNKGVAPALKEYEENYISVDDYFLYLDQDTKISLKSLLIIKNNYRKYFCQKDVGLLYVGGDIPYSKIVVNSGCIFSGYILRKYGYHCDSYFVEGVDYEYCYRLIKNNLKIIKFPVSGLDHISYQDGFFYYKLPLFKFQLKLRIYGQQRNIDFNKSHFKLILVSFKNIDFYYLYYFLRSLVIFNLSELLSNIIYKVMK
jgi:rhamnosyltransferase